MPANKTLNQLRRVEPRQMAVKMMRGRSSIAGAMLWMFGISLLLTLTLGWIPVLGPFIGPAAGGFVGGYRAGSIGRAMVAATLPALFLSIIILAFGTIAAAFADLAILGAVAAIVAGALALILIAHNLVLFFSALIGGLVSSHKDAF